MRVSKEKAAENRAAILDAASRLFRERGIDGIGVADIAREAGLTHGALYAHFPSKEALAAEAFSHGFQGLVTAKRKRPGDRGRSFQEQVDGFLSTQMRDKLGTGCPLTASASEIGRQGRAVSASFTRAFEEMVTALEGSLEDTTPASARRGLAVAAAAAEIGAVAVSRAVAKTDPALADEILHAVRKALGGLHETSRSSLKGKLR